MTTNGDQSLALYFPGIGELPGARRGAWERLFDEARVAAKSVNLALLREWGRQSLAIAVESTVARATALWSLLKAVAAGAWDEFKRFFRAFVTFKLGAYFKDACKRLWNLLRATWERIKVAAAGAKAFVASLPGASREQLVDYAVSLFGGVLGFVLIGGTGDGGVIDMDIAALGLGGHRSLFFHSALVGLAAEICFRSFFALAELLQARLPKDRSPIWDRLHGINRRFTHALVTGSWAGVATHLAVDSHVDGWTPYKDLPVVLPTWGHHLVMDLNAAAAGWLGWQWHKAGRLFRSDAIVPARCDGRQPQPLVQIEVSR